MKTGALIAFAVEGGAILGRARRASAQPLRDYGQALGAAFQIGDDILDVEATSAMLGKATGKDAARERRRSSRRSASRAPSASVTRSRIARVAALSAFDARADLLRAAARFTIERRA